MEKIEGFFGYKLGCKYYGPEVINIRPTEVLPFTKLRILTTLKSRIVFEMMAYSLTYQSVSLDRLCEALTKKYGGHSKDIWYNGDRSVYVDTYEKEYPDSVTYTDGNLCDIDAEEREDTTNDTLEV